MKRIYESSAIHRDDDDPFSPGKNRDDDRPSSFRTLPSSWLSNRLLPQAIRRRAVTVHIETPASTYDQGVRIPFTITMKNSMPFPVSIVTDSRLVWTWDVDGRQEAADVSLHDPEDEETSGITFARGERKVIKRHWDQMFQVDEREWERAPPGEHEIGAGLNVAGAEESGLYDRGPIRIDPV